MFCLWQGTIPGHHHKYQLDNGHILQTGKPELVCGNTAAMLGDSGRSWLAKHFEVSMAVRVACGMLYQHMGSGVHRRNLTACMLV